jgi:hypothetical protein
MRPCKEGKHEGDPVDRNHDMDAQREPGMKLCIFWIPKLDQGKYHNSAVSSRDIFSYEISIVQLIPSQVTDWPTTFHLLQNVLGLDSVPSRKLY